MVSDFSLVDAIESGIRQGAARAGGGRLDDPGSSRRTAIYGCGFATACRKRAARRRPSSTGQIRSSSTDEIACWFIDTNYNGESFFVRHAYFTGGDEPYEKLKRALRADIDEGAWSTLYSTSSRPFAPPETGKIAVKVINHYGDEVLKVYDVVVTPAT